MNGSTSAMKPAGSGANPLALHGISLSPRNSQHKNHSRGKRRIYLIPMIVGRQI
jgi:hypothetical protein